MEAVGSLPGLKQLRVEWGGPAAAVETGDLPPWVQERAVQLQILQLLARLLLLDVPFHPSTQWGGLQGADAAFPPGTSRAPAPRIVDLAMALGVHYVAAGDSNVRLHASSWLCSSLAHDPALLEGPRALTTARMLDAMRMFNGTMRGRPFELLCADALCFRSMMMQPVQHHQPTTASRNHSIGPHAGAAVPTLGQLLPHCAKTKLGASILPQLRVVVASGGCASGGLDQATRNLEPDEQGRCGGAVARLGAAALLGAARHPPRRPAVDADALPA
jgi:hypothetical protein